MGAEASKPAAVEQPKQQDSQNSGIQSQTETPGHTKLVAPSQQIPPPTEQTAVDHQKKPREIIAHETNTRDLRKVRNTPTKVKLGKTSTLLAYSSRRQKSTKLSPPLSGVLKHVRQVNTERHGQRETISTLLTTARAIDS